MVDLHIKPKLDVPLDCSQHGSWGREGEGPSKMGVARLPLREAIVKIYVADLCHSGGHFLKVRQKNL